MNKVKTYTIVQKMLRITLGPMYAGKTSALMRDYDECIGSKIIIDYNIVSVTDYSTSLYNHDNKQAVCIKRKKLGSYIQDNIFINEAQFFPNLSIFVKENHTKNIYIYGLDGDFQRNPIGQILELIPLCDTITKLHSKCLCGNKAIFTHRVSNETEQYMPHAKYIPCCRVCYLDK